MYDVMNSDRFALLRQLANSHSKGWLIIEDGRNSGVKGFPSDNFVLEDVHFTFVEHQQRFNIYNWGYEYPPQQIPQIPI
jgi:hypothetical protein